MLIILFVSLSGTNHLTKVPDDIGNLVNLEVLILSNNSLKKLPPAIGELKKLRILDLDENKIEVLPYEIGELSSLSKLTVNNNKLTTIPKSIGKLTNLESLHLSENKLLSLPEEIGSYFQPAEFPFFKVHMLSCNFQLILSSFLGPTGFLEKLFQLFVNDNMELQSLPYALALCLNLQIMNIEKCPLSKIPAEVVSSGPSTVIQYLRLSSSYREM